jgi:tRNA nucleotidyltransferase (CCA-adding enzyme)
MFIEGSAIDLASRLCERYAAFTIVATHERFGTATLRYSDNDYTRDVDLSTARTEFYQFPAALPEVEPSRLEQDLLRRDFYYQRHGALYQS